MSQTTSQSPATSPAGTNPTAGDAPHSAEQFGEQRDLWYDPGFLDRVAARAGLGDPAVSRMLEVGVGQGHWSALIAPRVPALAELTVVDFEPRWVADAEAALRKKLGARLDGVAISAVQADAQALPFADASFDLVTCQTVLMHLPRPEQALAEMCRVLRPGGVILVAEPSNLYPFAAFDSAAAALGLEVQSARYRLWLACHLGRIAQGRGDFNLGDRLPHLFRALPVEGFACVLNDKVHDLAPPYSQDARTLIGFGVSWLETALGDDVERTLGLAMAGGLERAEAQALVEVERRYLAEERRQLEAGTFVTGGGAVHYLAWARRAR